MDPSCEVWAFWDQKRKENSFHPANPSPKVPLLFRNLLSYNNKCARYWVAEGSLIIHGSCEMEETTSITFAGLWPGTKDSIGDIIGEIHRGPFGAPHPLQKRESPMLHDQNWSLKRDLAVYTQQPDRDNCEITYATLFLRCTKRSTKKRVY